MDRVLLSWNIPNWITVVLMAAAGYFVLALVSQLVLNKSGQQQQAAS